MKAIFDLGLIATCLTHQPGMVKVSVALSRGIVSFDNGILYIQLDEADAGWVGESVLAAVRYLRRMRALQEQGQLNERGVLKEMYEDMLLPLGGEQIESQRSEDRVEAERADATRAGGLAACLRPESLGKPVGEEDQFSFEASSFQMFEVATEAEPSNNGFSRAWVRNAAAPNDLGVFAACPPNEAGSVAVSLSLSRGTASIKDGNLHFKFDESDAAWTARWMIAAIQHLRHMRNLYRFEQLSDRAFSRGTIPAVGTRIT